MNRIAIFGQAVVSHLFVSDKRNCFKNSYCLLIAYLCEMISQNINILLADDDKADCLLFKEALEELPVSAHLSMVHNGEQLLEELKKHENKLPDVLFLDLNMPRKSGFASLGEIKRNTTLEELPVIIFSTSSELGSVKRVFRDAAHYYICKPVDFLQLKKVIYEALTLITQTNNRLPLEDDFVITGASIIIPDSHESKSKV